MNCRLLRSQGTLAVVFWGCALFVVACLTARLFWRAAVTETGLSSLRLSWRDAVVGWAAGHYEPVNRREPVEQAEFWLRETDRVLARHPNDATLAMGAAMVLDSPGYEFVLHYVREFFTFEEYRAPVFDEAGIKRARDAFEERCKDRCLELAATATTRDPANPTWWRYYALLLCRPYDSTPRVSNWLEVLAQCARHDPDNALYDYLAAHFHWEAAGEIVFPDPERDGGANLSEEPAGDAVNDEWDLGEWLAISDPAEFERGVVRFNQGLEKDRFSFHPFSFHPDGTAPAFRFLARSRVPAREHPRIASSRHGSIEANIPLRSLSYWQYCQAKEEMLAGHPAAAMELHRQNFRLLAQYRQSNPHDFLPLFSATRTALRMTEIADAHPDVFSDSERQQHRTALEDAMLEQEIALAAMDMLAERGRQATANGPGWVSALIAGIAPPMVILLVTVGLLAALVARYRSPGILPRPGLIGQALAFGVAATGTIVLLGLAPAEIVDRNVQAWSFTACVFLMPLALLSWIAAHWLRSGPLRLSVPGVLAATLIFYLGIGLVTLVLAFEFILEHLPLPLSVPARVWEGAAARILGDVAKHNQSDVFLAAVQWLLYHGPWITLALWAGLLLGMHWLKMYRGHRQTSPGLGRAKRLGAMVGALGRPALGLATIVLIAYLVVKPAVLHRVEDRFQHDIAMMRDLERSWAVQVEDAIRTLRADKQSMDRLREAAKAKASSTHP